MKALIVPLVAAVWAAAIWFAGEGYWRSDVSVQDIRSAATGLYGLSRLNDSYSGPIAKVSRDDGKSIDIGTVSDMRQFCAQTTCVVRTMYDQSGNGAHMNKVD